METSAAQTGTATAEPLSTPSETPSVAALESQATVCPPRPPPSQSSQPLLPKNAGASGRHAFEPLHDPSRRVSLMRTISLTSIVASLEIMEEAAAATTNGGATAAQTNPLTAVRPATT